MFILLSWFKGFSGEGELLLGRALLLGEKRYEWGYSVQSGLDFHSQQKRP